MHQILVFVGSLLTVTGIPYDPNLFETWDRERFRSQFTRTLQDYSETIDQHPAFPHLVEIARLGGWGLLETERSAFLTIDGKGDVRCVLWPQWGTRRESRFRGAMPYNTVAIIHTHPRNTPHPSRMDATEASRLGVPVLVVTPRDLTAVSPEGNVIEIVDSRWWISTSEDSVDCIEV